MKKYIIFFILSLFLGQEVMAKEGMPQLNPEFWLSQIFWLVIFFGFLYFLIHKFFSPKLFSLIDQRADFLKSLINETENNKNQIEQLKNNSLEKVSSKLAFPDILLQEIENGNALPSNDFRVTIRY